MANSIGGPEPLVPIISVTSHSPGSKQYSILDDNLQHLHKIQDTIQNMRHAPFSGNNNVLRLNQSNRISSSCPSLQDLESDLDVISCTNSTIPFLTRGSLTSKQWLASNSGLDGDLGRRKSWSKLEDFAGGKGIKTCRQRSMSLSSLDSEQDDPFSDQHDSGSTALLITTGKAMTVTGRRTKRTNGGSSTHSLNEADLQNDFNVEVAKRESENMRLLPARLPLQKSVSTPSIIAVRDVPPEVAVDSGTVTMPVCQLRPSGTESETEEEVITSILDRSRHFIDLPANRQIHFQQLLADNYDAHSEKRRKRGSLFFRKKKDKIKKAVHQWLSVSYGTPRNCDWCTKPLNNKPALYCDGCSKTVHASSCKDQVSDCTKPKSSKASSKPYPFPKRGSTSQQGSNSNSQIISEEDLSSHHSEALRSQDDATFSSDFLDDIPVTVQELETDPFLGLDDKEPESWSPTVGKEVLKRLEDKEIKRQEHMYEFILTEKHHCLTLRVMQKVFVEGMKRHFQLGSDVDRMFPRLADLTEIHFRFLYLLRQRQKVTPAIETISDILLEQFSGTCAQKLKSAYGEFCSHHRDALDIYKYHSVHDRKFGEFVRHCQQNPLLKKKGIPECILFVTQRLTKYPLLIEALIKSTKDNKAEQERLQKALTYVKEILIEVNGQVAEKEKEDRKLEIYHRIDAKSFTVHRNNKFKKSDILSDNRKLKFEGTAMLMQGRSKVQYVLVIVLSDVLFFLQDNNSKYSFFTPDNKAGVVSLQKLLVREKAGADSKGIYLISSHPAEPEMFELKIHKPKDKQIWIQAIRNAVQNCPEEEEEGAVLSNEEKQKLLESKQAHIRQIVDILRQKAHEQAILLEEKMALQLKLLAASGLTNVPEPPSYSHLVAEDADTGSVWKKVIGAVQEVNELANSLYASGTNLSRSVSSVGERQSDAYISPTLPKRAETFGGFDNTQVPGSKLGAIQKKHKDSLNSNGAEASEPDKNKIQLDQFSWRDAIISAIPPDLVGTGTNGNPDEIPPLLTLGREQQLAAVHLSHYVYTLLCIIWQQMTSIDSLQAQLSVCKSQLSSDDRDKRPYRHNHQLEELRNLQDKLNQDKEAWQKEKELEEKELEEKRCKLLLLESQLREEQKDITNQREQLYRKMEILTNQGLLVSPNMPVVTPPPQEEFHIQSPPASVESRRKSDTQKWKSSSLGKTGSLPPNLLSATNQQKVPPNVQIKQQLPLKLAANNKVGSLPSPSAMSGVQQMLPMKLSQTGEGRRSSSGRGHPVGGYQRLGSSNSPPGDQSPHSHSRTGSSPAAMMQSSPPGSPNSQKITAAKNAYANQPENQNEKVIFF
ncbi:UNVERIFIED_CONTAM: hypothetical protein PYX00_000509 [Menopon gallinae]